MGNAHAKLVMEHTRDMENSAAPLSGHSTGDSHLRSWRSHALALGLYALSVGWLAVFTLPHYMWGGHDSPFPVVRVRAMAALWRAEGAFQAPWMADQCFGYGWPFFTFYSPLGYWVGAALSFLPGVDCGRAVQGSFGLSVLLGGLFMYAFVLALGRERGWPRLPLWGAVVAAVYSLAPYHLCDLFTRAALAECWGWTWLPLLLLGAERCRAAARPGVLLVAAGTAGLILSHNITALYGVLFTALYVAAQAHGLRWPLLVAGGGFWGVLMAAFFWYPVMRLMPLVAASSLAYGPKILHEHSVYWIQYLVETPGRGLSVAGPGDQLGINLGLAVLLCALLAFAALVARRVPRGGRWSVAWMLVLLLAYLFAMSPQMDWARVPRGLHFVQFPWRLLIFAVLCACVATVHALPAIDRWIHPVVLMAFCVLLALSTPRTTLWFNPRVVSDATLDDFVAQEQYARFHLAGCEAPEYLPLAVPRHYAAPAWQLAHPAPENRLTVVDGDLAVRAYEHRGTLYRYAYDARQESTVRLHVFDFPGWRLRLDGADRPDLRRGDADGLVGAALPAGTHELLLDYTISPPGRQARWTSAAAWVAWGVVTAQAIRATRRARRAPAAAG